jgi:2-polyprenyl-3-methyl-5-hydroxy-6-metoxy-1,4-benzoquinol methylase
VSRGRGLQRAAFANLLGSQWFVHPRIAHKLQEPGARLADIACGAARSSIAIARAYPLVTIDAVDNDPMSIDVARRNVREAGLEDRIEVKLADGESVGGPFDVATIFEAVHDLANPVGVLKAIHRSEAGRILLVVDENVADDFVAPAENLESFFYAASLLVCLPTAMADKPSAATGTVMRPATLGAYAREAGFATWRLQALTTRCSGSTCFASDVLPPVGVAPGSDWAKHNYGRIVRGVSERAGAPKPSTTRG